LVKGRDQKDHFTIKETNWKIEPSHLTHHAKNLRTSSFYVTLKKGWWRHWHGMDFLAFVLSTGMKKKNLEIYPPVAKKGLDS
jgi:hypothetical protein